MTDDRTLGRKALEELGLISLYHSPLDVKLLCAQRLIRQSAYAASTLILVPFLAALGNTATTIGAFMTLTMAGDVAVSLALTVFADALGRKAILCAGATLMVGSGVVFALASNYWVLLAAAVLGVVSPSGNEIGPFRAVEESIIAHLTLKESRADVYAWYSLAGQAGQAVGMVVAGWFVHHLLEDRRWEILAAYRLVFYGYAALGGLKLVLALLLSGRVEAELENRPAVVPAPPAIADEARPLLHTSETEQGKAERPKKAKKRSFLPPISKETRLVALWLCLLFALDSFASGEASLSWLTYFFRWKFNIEDGLLGTIFSVTSIIAAASMLVSASIAKRFGNVNTMVFTHLPSSILLSLISVSNNMQLSLTFLILRACTQSMDTAVRSAFLAAILQPSERTAILGLTNVVKTSAQSLGLLITGMLADRKLFWAAFVMAGGLKAIYDLGLLALFKNHEKDSEARDRLARETADEERNGSQTG